VTSRLHLADADRTRLREHAESLGVVLGPDSIERFAEYATLLETWADRTNLISCPHARELVDRHFLDSLILAEMVTHADIIVDLGSGAGFPGVPLAIAFPQKRVLLVEPRRRRASFLREVRRTIVANAEVLARRAEITSGEPTAAGDVVVSRAVWSDATILDAAAPWTRVGGALLWVRGVDATAPAAEHSGLLRWRRSKVYAIAGSHRGRVEVFERDPAQ
jgi:16S rRNA (guanine527-N7)-methyltransferase